MTLVLLGAKLAIAWGVAISHWLPGEPPHNVK